MNVCPFTVRDCALSVSVHFAQINAYQRRRPLIPPLHCLRRNDWKRAHRSIPWHSLWEAKTHGRTIYFKALVSGNLITIIDRRSVKRLGRHRESHDASIFFFLWTLKEEIPSLSLCSRAGKDFRSTEMPFPKFSGGENNLERELFIDG